MLRLTVTRRRTSPDGSLMLVGKQDRNDGKALDRGGSGDHPPPPSLDIAHRDTTEVTRLRALRRPHESFDGRDRRFGSVRGVWSLYGAPWLQPAAISGKSPELANPKSKPNPLPRAATCCVRRSMVSRASAVGRHPLREDPSLRGSRSIFLKRQVLRTRRPTGLDRATLTGQRRLVKLLRTQRKRGLRATYAEATSDAQLPSRRHSPARRCASVSTKLRTGTSM